MIGQHITSRLSRGSVATPALGIVPFVATAGGIHMDGNQADIPFAQLQAQPVDSPAPFVKGNVIVLRNQEFSVKTEGGETGHHTPGDFPVVGPFKETAVRRALSCSFSAVSVID